MDVHFYGLQKEPSTIVMFALGLASTEESDYCKDLLENLPKTWTIVTIRGYETLLPNKDEKLFLKNNTTRIKNVFEQLKGLYPDTKMVGLGVSLGGALLLQALHKKEIYLDGLIIVSTSLHYQHALETMHETWMGMIASRLLVLCQFWCLYRNPNYLHRNPIHIRLWTWFRLYFSWNLLSHDRILSELYGFDYDHYIKELDLRKTIASDDVPIYYLFSKNDPMFSPSHQQFMITTLEAFPHVEYECTDFGHHAEFSLLNRNDFLVRYVIKSVNNLLV